MKEKEVIWIDMDGVLVDFNKHVNDTISKNQFLKENYKGRYDHIPGIFRNPPPIEGAIEATPWGNPMAAMDKRFWIEEHFGNLFKKKMVISHLKNMLIGDYLIDDRTANGAGEFKGELLRFGWAYETETWNEYPTWESILKKLL